MTDAKLSWTELRRALSARAGISEKEANTFLNALNTQLTEGLKSDKQVKVNGLGTFKLQAVAPRKSVNVTTGELITLAGYNKIAFAPEAGVKELVEKSHGELGETAKALQLNEPVLDPLKKLGAQAEEIVDILGELGQSPVKAESGKKKAESKKKKAKPQPVVEPKEEPKAEPIAEPVAAPEPIIEPKPVVESKPVVEPKPKKQYHFVRDTLICVVILLMLLLVGYFFLRSQLSTWMEEMRSVEPVTVVVEEKTVAAEVEEAVVEEPEEVIEEQAVEPEAVEPAVVEPAEEQTYTEWITIEEMHEASRLAWMAKRYYGDKIYWPYLYDANKDHIKNPSQIAVGTPIRVPKLSKAQLDTTSVQFQRLREEAYGKVVNGK